MKEEQETPPDQLDRIKRKSAEWVVKHDKGLTAEELDSFFQWLGDDPRHGECFAASKQSWKDFNQLAQWRPEHSEEPNPDLLATLKSLRSWKKWSVLGGLAAALALVTFSWIQDEDPVVEPVEQYVVTDTTLDHGYHRLEDGSEIDLNEQTELVVAYSDKQRLIQLISGEAHFMVKKDPDRPFVVEAGGTKVMAIGTAFNVRVAKDSVEVLVTEGRVRMEDAKEEGRPSPQRNFSHDLVSGQRSIISLSAQAPRVEDISEGEMDEMLYWKPDVLDFSSTPLSEAISAFNERNEVRMVIADSELAHQPIVASFRSNNINGFVRLLHLTMGIEADYQGDSEIVLYKSH